MYAYCKIVAEFLKRDPNNAVIAFSKMMRDQIQMPAHYMDDGKHMEMNSGRQLFSDFAGVAENLGVYTAKDYAEIMKWLINYWKIDQMTGLNNEALAEQQYVCALPDRILKLAERSAERKKRQNKKNLAKFSWVFNKELIF